MELCTLHDPANVSTGILVVNRGSCVALLRLTQILRPNGLNCLESRLFLVGIEKESTCGKLSVGWIEKLLPNYPVDTCLCQEEREEFCDHLPLELQRGMPCVGLGMRW